jgi:hypothetical protein
MGDICRTKKTDQVLESLVTAECALENTAFARALIYVCWGCSGKGLLSFKGQGKVAVMDNATRSQYPIRKSIYKEPRLAI